MLVKKLLLSFCPFDMETSSHKQQGLLIEPKILIIFKFVLFFFSYYVQSIEYCLSLSLSLSLAECGPEWSIRLVGGNTATEGRVEVCLHGTWGTVSHDFWGRSDALVVCRQLGFSDIGEQVNKEPLTPNALYFIQLLKHFRTVVLDEVLDQFIWTMCFVLVENFDYKIVLTH